MKIEAQNGPKSKELYTKKLKYRKYYVLVGNSSGSRDAAKFM